MRSFLVAVLFSIVGITQVEAKDCFPSRPNSLLYDEVNLFSPQEQKLLEKRLHDFSNQTSNQIAVVVVKDLCGYDPAGYSFELGEKWGVGQKGKDNGVVILIKPTGGKGQRHTFIATGYGLEGAIPDAVTDVIVDNEMIPNFKQKRFYQGVNAALDVLMPLAKGEFNHQDYTTKKKGAGLKKYWFVLIIIAFIIFSRIRSAKRYADDHGTSLWTSLWLVSMMNTGSRGRYDDFSSGGGSFGGGGFGGFGGGSFGGGGSGGSW